MVRAIVAVQPIERGAQGAASHVLRKTRSAFSARALILLSELDLRFASLLVEPVRVTDIHVDAGPQHAVPLEGVGPCNVTSRAPPWLGRYRHLHGPPSDGMRAIPAMLSVFCFSKGFRNRCF